MLHSYIKCSKFSSRLQQCDAKTYKQSSYEEKKDKLSVLWMDCSFFYCEGCA